MFNNLKEKLNGLIKSGMVGLNTGNEITSRVNYELYPIKEPIRYKPIICNEKTSERLRKIVEKIEYIRREYKHYVNLRFKEPCSLDELQAFEGKYNVAFPDEYKEFITTVGVGNGPGIDGVFSPYEKPKSLEYSIPEYFEKRLISEPFRYNSDIANEIISRKLNNKAYECYKDVSGCFFICDHDMGFYDLIVMNGEQKGRVWSYIDGWLEPKHILGTDGYKQMSFYDWVEEWLNNLDYNKR